MLYFKKNLIFGIIDGTNLHVEKGKDISKNMKILELK